MAEVASASPAPPAASPSSSSSKLPQADIKPTEDGDKDTEMANGTGELSITPTSHNWAPRWSTSYFVSISPFHPLPLIRTEWGLGGQGGVTRRRDGSTLHQQPERANQTRQYVDYSLRSAHSSLRLTDLSLVPSNDSHEAIPQSPVQGVRISIGSDSASKYENERSGIRYFGYETSCSEGGQGGSKVPTVWQTYGTSRFHSLTLFIQASRDWR